MKIPEVRIYFSWLLHENISVHMDKQLNDGSWTMDDEETSRRFAENYRKKWAEYNDTILPALTEVLGVEFYSPVIDAPCAHWFKAQSDPLMMSFYYPPDQFVDVLTHELCHVLLTDNTVYSIKSSDSEVDLQKRWAKLFGEHEFNTTVHIPVHALCKYVFVDVLNEPSRIERDIKDIAENAAYVESWDYVNAHDYSDIIAKLKQDFVELKNELFAKK